jgi:NTP pyrophosphatase (non-canonical NTP hydrolase)
MKLTLRKANAVQAAINEMIKGLDLSTTVTLNEFEDVEEQISAVRDRFQTHSATRYKLMMALYEIRNKVAQANASAGINDLLADVAYLEKQISYNTMLAGKGAQTSLRVLNGQVKKLSEVKEDGYGYSRRDMTTSIFTEEEIEDFRRTAADFKRQKQSLQDTLLELNVQTEIQLNEETARFLEKADIL